MPHPRKCRDYLNQPAQRESNVPSKKGRPAPIEPCSPRATAHLLHAPWRCARFDASHHANVSATHPPRGRRTWPFQGTLLSASSVTIGIERVETGE